VCVCPHHPPIIAMSATNEAVTLSKSARKRANKKEREAEGGAEEEAPPPAPVPAAKSKAAAKPKAEPKAPEPAPGAKAKAKGKAKAEPKAPEPAPAPKAEAQAKGKAQPKAAAEPKAAEPKAKASAKAKAKAKKEAEEDEELAKKAADKAGPVFYAEVDDGSRADEWEVSSGLSSKRQKQQQKMDEKKASEKERKAAGVLEARGSQYIPGMAPVDVQVKQAKGKAGDTAKANQSVSAVAVVSAAAADNKGKEPEKAAVSDNNTSATVKVPENRIGIVVGPKGSTIIMIKEKTGVKTIDMQGEMCTIVGPPDAVALAEHAVRQLVEKGYMAIAYDDFEEEGVPCLPSLFPDLIGSKGCIIQLIKKEAKVEVTIPAVPKNAKDGQKFKVTLAGSKTAVALGKEIIKSIAMYGHHEITHPGQTHQEMEIEEWKWRYLIGSKGSEMRHIQNNYKVRVSIPREHSECQNVVVVGEPRDVDRASKYIEKMMWEAEQPRGRGAPEASADDGYDDAPQEDWMKAYMYQRK